MRLRQIWLYQDTRAARGLLWAILAGGGILLAAPARSAEESASWSYLRAYLDSKEKFGGATAQTEGVVEVRGMVQGKMSSQQATTWILRGEGDDEASYQVISPIDYPAFVVGSRVRVLGRGLAASGSTLELVAMVLESEMAAWEKKHAPQPPPRREPTRIITYPPQSTPAPAQPARTAAPQRQEASDPPQPSPGPTASAPSAPAPPRWKEPSGRSGPSASKSGKAPAKPAAQPMTSRGWAGYLDAYKNAIRYFNPRLSDAQQDAIARSILAYSAHYKIDARLIVAVIAVESGFKPTATSHKGAMGLGQLMPGTAAGLGVRNAYDPVENIYGAVKLLRGHMKQHSGKPFWNQLELALASYNAGSGAVRKYGGVPPYRETQRYVVKVAQLYAHLCGYKPKD